MGFIKILRWRIGGALSRLGKPAHPIEIGPLQRAAVFVIVMGREHAALLFEEFSPEESRLLTTEVNEFTEIDKDLVREVLQEFLDGFTGDELPNYVPLSELDEVARAHVRSESARAVERIRFLWLKEQEQEEDEDESFLEIGYEALGSLQKAAVFVMWLPPELSSMVFAHFNTNQVHALSSVIVELPFVIPEAREIVLSDFMEGVTLGIPGLSVEDVGLPVVVEAFVRSNPERVARRLERLWLKADTPLPVHGEAKPKDPLENLAPQQRCAIFFQSLSLPLGYRLLSAMEPEEVEGILATIEELGGVSPELRKTVLEELMTGSQGSAEFQSAGVLGKAVASMIRKRPEVVAAKVRKQWLSE